VDVLFTNINLAGDMDGSTLAIRVRGLRPELPIVYCSGRFAVGAVAAGSALDLYAQALRSDRSVRADGG
jgi:hypothetical protein